MNVRQGFSMPPYGKLGGIISKSYVFHTYGPQISSAIDNICDVSENSAAQASTILSSAHTFELSNETFFDQFMLIFLSYVEMKS